MAGVRPPLAAILLAMSLIAAAALSTASAVNGQDAALSDVVKGLALRSEPVTIRLPARPGLAAASAAAQSGDGALALAVHDLTGTSTEPVRINVFVDMPDANRTTSPDDPHFVGELSIYPKDGRIGTGGSDLELTQGVTADAGKPLQVTFVPVVGSAAAPRDLSLQVGQIYVRHDRGS